MNSKRWPNHRTMTSLAGALLAIMLSATATLAGQPQSAEQAIDTSDLDIFVRQHAQLCGTGSVRICFERGFAFIDDDGDGKISLDEAKIRKVQATAWFEQNQERLHPLDRQAFVAGIAVINLITLEQVIASYDFNDDGSVDSIEATADIALDDRPAVTWVRDPKSVNWNGVMERLGAGGPLLRLILQQAGLAKG